MQILESEKHGDVLIVKIFHEELNASIAEKFKEETSLLVEQGNKYIVLDMSKVKFMDSSGLGALISFLKKTRNNADMTLFGIKKMVFNLLKLTRTNKAFKIYKTRDEAIAAVLEG